MKFFGVSVTASTKIPSGCRERLPGLFRTSATELPRHSTYDTTQQHHRAGKVSRNLIAPKQLEPRIGDFSASRIRKTRRSAVYPNHQDPEAEREKMKGNPGLSAGYLGSTGFRKVVKCTILIKKKDGMSDEDFVEYYNNKHAQMATDVILRHQPIAYSLV